MMGDVTAETDTESDSDPTPAAVFIPFYRDP
ncbi:MAG: hypothetical protein QOK26_1808, partial [Pseudonocardiales bacterium]|nr:hypothetical protein [Pseudonocardiales bacterium]